MGLYANWTRLTHDNTIIIYKPIHDFKNENKNNKTSQ